MNRLIGEDIVDVKLIFDLFRVRHLDGLAGAVFSFSMAPPNLNPYYLHQRHRRWTLRIPFVSMLFIFHFCVCVWFSLDCNSCVIFMFRFVWFGRSMILFLCSCVYLRCAKKSVGDMFVFDVGLFK